MRTLFCAALFLIGAEAHTAVIAQAENNAGGHINLTDEQAGCPANQRLAFSTSSVGEVNLGCWWGGNDHIWVLYNNGTFRAYKPGLFWFNTNKKGS